MLARDAELLANGLACPERHETATIVLRLRDDAFFTFHNVSFREIAADEVIE